MDGKNNFTLIMFELHCAPETGFFFLFINEFAPIDLFELIQVENSLNTKVMKAVSSCRIFAVFCLRLLGSCPPLMTIQKSGKTDYDCYIIGFRILKSLTTQHHFTKCKSSFA